MLARHFHGCSSCRHTFAHRAAVYFLFMVGNDGGDGDVFHYGCRGLRRRRQTLQHTKDCDSLGCWTGCDVYLTPGSGAFRVMFYWWGARPAGKKAAAPWLQLGLLAAAASPGKILPHSICCCFFSFLSRPPCARWTPRDAMQLSRTCHYLQHPSLRAFALKERCPQRWEVSSA